MKNNTIVMNMINAMTIRERKDGKLEGRLTVNGIRKSFYGNTKAEIKTKAKEYLNDIENGFKEPEKIKLNEYIEYWLYNYKWGKVEPSTYTRLYRVYDCQIRNSIGNMMIGKVTTKDIQKLIDSHSNPPENSDIKALAISGLKRIIHLLSPCFERAVKDGIISDNPCNDVILPIQSNVQKETKQQFTLDDKEIAEFKNVVLEKYKGTGEYKSRDAFVLIIILNLGLRVGEALALKWNDFDLERNLVFINKTVQSNVMSEKNDTHSISYKVKDSTKTPSGCRVIKINEKTRYFIEELKKYDERKGICSDYFCSTNVGTLNSPRNLQRSLDRLIGRTNIDKKVTLHTLRHTFGSTLLRKGVQIEVVSKLMGHANVNITYLKYIHVLQEQTALAMDMVSVVY